MEIKQHNLRTILFVINIFKLLAAFTAGPTVAWLPAITLAVTSKLEVILYNLPPVLFNTSYQRNILAGIQKKYWYLWIRNKRLWECNTTYPII